MTELRQWSRQWARLARQEAELSEAAAPPTSREERRAQPGVTHEPPLAALRAQLARQAEALRMPHDGAPPSEVQRHARQCEAAAAALAAQLADLQRQEAAAAAEFDAAAAAAAQLLAAAPSTARRDAAAPAAGDAASGAGPAAAPSSHLPPEVLACDAYMQRHGPTGGWHPDDHAEFERALRAARGNRAHCVTLCHQALGLLHSAQDIEAHARWHEELQRLQTAKRLAVQRWRVARQQEQAALVEQQGAAAAAAAESSAGAASSRAAQEQEQQAQEQQRAAVAAWRAEREAARAAAEAARREEEEAQRAREAERRHLRQQENRQLLEAARRGKEAGQADGQLSEERSGASCASTQRSAAADPATRQRLRQRNEQLLGRRAAAARRRSDAAAEQAERVARAARRASEQWTDGVERDPSRLLQATSSAALRQLAALAEERGPRDSGFIRHLPRRATPTWCAGARLQ